MPQSAGKPPASLKSSCFILYYYKPCSWFRVKGCLKKIPQAKKTRRLPLRRPQGLDRGFAGYLLLGRLFTGSSDRAQLSEKRKTGYGGVFIRRPRIVTQLPRLRKVNGSRVQKAAPADRGRQNGDGRKRR